jgi:hypothetical protein
MTDAELDAYLADLSPAQCEAIRGVRALIAQHDPGLRERVIDGKWLTGLIGYCAADGEPIYALGPRGKDKITLHLMPYYASRDLQERHGAALERFLTGKSCLEFRKLDDLPLDAIVEILEAGSASFLAAKGALRPPR